MHQGIIYKILYPVLHSYHRFRDLDVYVRPNFLNNYANWGLSSTIKCQHERLILCKLMLTNIKWKHFIYKSYLGDILVYELLQNIECLSLLS